MRTEIKMLTVVAGLLAACSETDRVFTGQEAEAESPQSEAGQVTGMTVLGARIPNVYTPEVMGEALAMLKAEAATNKSADIALGETEVAATHLYLRFAPRDSTDVALLDNDTTIMYTVLPMDYEVAAIGDYYHDPSLPDSVPTHQCCTDKDGRFRFSRRRHHVRCCVKWRRDDFHLREIGHPIQQAESTLASHTKSSVSHTFIPGYDSWLYASVFRAAHQYYYNYAAYGLSRPGDKNLIIRLSGKTSVSKLGCYENFAPLGLSDIKIYYKKANNGTSRALFQTTVHEIAHCTHRLWDRSRYRDTEKKVKESWARGVEIHMARTFYSDCSAIKNYFGNYTSVVPDLLDAKIPMPIIEQALRGSEKWETWKVNVARLSPSKKKMVYEIFEQN